MFNLDKVDNDRRLVEWYQEVRIAIRNDMICIAQDIQGFSRHLSFFKELTSKSLLISMLVKLKSMLIELTVFNKGNASRLY